MKTRILFFFATLTSLLTAQISGPTPPPGTSVGGDVSKAGNNAFTGDNSFTKEPRRIPQDLAAGAELALGVNYYDTISAPRELAFLGTPEEGSRTSVTFQVTVSVTLTIPSCKRVGQANSAITEMTLAGGTVQTLVWEYKGDTWYLTDSVYESSTSAAATDLDGGSVLAVGGRYYDVFPTDRNINFSGTPVNGSTITLIADTTSYTSVLSFPAHIDYRRNNALRYDVALNGTVELLEFEYQNGKWYLNTTTNWPYFDRLFYNYVDTVGYGRNGTVVLSGLDGGFDIPRYYVIEEDYAFSDDDSYRGLGTFSLNNTGGVTQWDAVYLDGSSAWRRADADGSGTYPARGLAVTTESTGDPVNVLIRGKVRNDAWNWTPGGKIYLSETAGGLTQTAPTSNVQVVGYALDADVAEFLFVPDQPQVGTTAYGAGWNGSAKAATEDAIYDKIESLSVGGGSAPALMHGDALPATYAAYIRDDFFFGATVGLWSANTTSGAGSGSYYGSGDGTHPGVWFLLDGTSTSGYASLRTTLTNIVFNGLSWSYYARVKTGAALPDAAPNAYAFAIGFGDATNSLPTDGAVFYADATSANWQGYTRNNSSGSAATGGSAVALATSTWYDLKLTVNSAGTAATFYVWSGSAWTSIGSSSATIPTGAGRETGFQCSIWSLTGNTTSSTWQIDQVIVVAY